MVIYVFSFRARVLFNIIIWRTRTFWLQSYAENLNPNKLIMKNMKKFCPFLPFLPTLILHIQSLTRIVAGH